MTTRRVIPLLLAAAAVACNDSTTPIGPPDHLVLNGGDQQNWYFNNPLPSPYSVTVLDVNNRPLPGVSVNWAPLLGVDGSYSSNPSTTDASGIATTIHTLGSATIYVTNVTVTGVPAIQFVAHASAPPTTAAVSVGNTFFDADSVVVQNAGTVTWTWNSGTTQHTVTYTGGPTPLPTNSTPLQGTSTFSTTFTNVGTYSYQCSFHPTVMRGKVVVVN